jgi:hypothetical protein
LHEQVWAVLESTTLVIHLPTAEPDSIHFDGVSYRTACLHACLPACLHACLPARTYLEWPMRLGLCPLPT